MRKRLVFCLLSLLLIAIWVAPVTAQESDSLAASFPVSAAIYAEVDLTAEAKLHEVVRLIDTLSGNESHLDEDIAQARISTVFSMIMPGVDFADIEPWLGDTAAIAFYAPDDQLTSDHFLAIVPASDPAALAEHRDALVANRTELATEGDVTFYELFMGFQFAVLPDALWIGSEDELNLALDVRSGTGDALADNAIFNRLWSQLPADAPLQVGASGRLLRNEAGEEGVSQLQRGLQILLRLNPSTSETETALLNVDWIDSVGVAADLVDNQIEITAFALADAQYPAPTLSSETAGAALLDYIPGDAVLVFDSYDAGMLTVSGAILVMPAVSNVFDTIIEGLEGGTPAPTPTPPPTPTVDEVIEQEIRPVLAQVEMMFGTEMDEIFSLLSGEYAFAMFGGLEGPLMGSDTGGMTGALWLQTSDPERFVEVLDTGIQNGVALNSNSSTTIERREETYNNRRVIVWGDSSSMGDTLAYGILSDDVVFITAGATAPLVTQASLGDGVLPQSNDFPADIIASMGTGNEALLYVNPAAISILSGNPNISPLGTIVATVDAQDNGVFVLRVVIPVPAE